MIEIIDHKFREIESSYGDKSHKTYVCKSLVQLEPHIMKYRYASKEYFLSVPWTYFVLATNLTVDNVYQSTLGTEGTWRVVEKATFEKFFFSQSTSDDSAALNAPISNICHHNLCFHGITKHSRVNKNEKDEVVKDFLNFSNNKIKNLTNLIYSEFTNYKGNNDYSFNTQLSREPLLFWFYKAINRKIDSWPKFFQSWEKLGELPLEFWPSNYDVVLQTYFETYPPYDDQRKKIFEDSFLSLGKLRSDFSNTQFF